MKEGRGEGGIEGGRVQGETEKEGAREGREPDSKPVIRCSVVLVRSLLFSYDLVTVCKVCLNNSYSFGYSELNHFSAY